MISASKQKWAFFSMIEHLKENLNWIWNSLSIEDQHQFNQNTQR